MIVKQNYFLYNWKKKIMYKSNYKNIYYLLVIILLIQCKPQETVAPVYYEIIPQFTTVEKLGTLKPGHSKATVMSKLGVAPWDVYSLTENGCQTFVYKYKKLKHEVGNYEMASNSSYISDKVLTTDSRKYDEPSKANLVFRNGELESIITEVGNGLYKDLVWDITKINEECDKPVIRGCTDPNSLNYNPDAVFDDGNCEYCPCGYELVKNENNDNPNCNEKPKCVKIKSDSVVVEPEIKEPILKRKPKCTKCDVIDKVLQNGSGNLDMRIIMNGTDFEDGEIIINEKGEIVE